MQPVKVSWIRCANIDEDEPFEDALDASDVLLHIARIESCPHPAFEIAPNVFIEIPDTEWAHGDFLVYLPERHWMVRRNYRSRWYVDIGIFKGYGSNLYGWTDLWLDVLAPDLARTYHVLDADEFAGALRDGDISVDNAVLALYSLNDLLTFIRNDEFPVPEIKSAEAFYDQYMADRR